MTMTRLLATLVVTYLCTSEAIAGQDTGPVDPQTVTFRHLLTEMTDLEGMTRFPSPSYTTRQFSSYERASTSPKEEGWFANYDRGHYLRTEQRDGRTEYVMMDAEGPGAVVRIWSANPVGTLRIYLDGSDAPVVEAPMAEVLDGQFASLPDSIAGVRSQGYNLYLPIPYAERCKITSDAGDFYYIINYRDYEQGTPVQTFRSEQLQSLRPQIEQAGKRLASPRSAGVEPQDVLDFDVDLGPGQSTSLGDFSGTRAISQFTANLEAAEVESALRGVVLTITFDGEQTVEVPLGDFFGTAPGINPYESLPLGMTAAGEMWSHWVMPFQDSARLEVRNLSDQPVSLQGNIGTIDYEWSDRSMHFNAGYRAQYDVPTLPRIDWNFLTAEGKGVFAGVSYTVDNPVRQWWGEGDEKIYVDGEDFPSWFGTGTEDYFGYAWGSPELFTHAYHAQPRCDGPDTYGHVSNNRFHIIDRIPFEESFRFDMEVWHWADCEVNLTATTYWYARPGSSDAYETLSEADLVVRPIPEYVAPRVEGAIEGEEMEILEKTANVAPQSWNGTSGDQHLWWHGGPRPGDELVLGFDVPEAGRYRVLGRFLKASDYGILQLAINDQSAGEPIDFYHDSVIVSEEIDLGVFDLAAGDNRFSATVVGANPNAKKEYLFGLDYLILKPADEAPVANPQGQSQREEEEALAGNERPIVTAGAFTRIYDPGVGEGEPWYINDHSFVLDDAGTWHLFGITHAEPAAPLDEDHLAHATASTLTQQQWEKQPFALSADGQRWDETHLWAPHIIRHDGTYYMFYCAGDEDHAKYKIHVATSPDLKSWTRHPENPILVDGFDARDPMILRVGDEWVLYYTATSRPEGGDHVVKAIVSRDLIHWSGERTVFTAPRAGTFGGPTESPFVVRRGEFYYLFCGAWDGYVGTRVFQSRDPFHWSVEDQVGSIESHAAEVVRDRNGRWYVTHCGWGQGGVHIAPLQWNDGQDEADTSLPIPTTSTATTSAQSNN